MDRTFIFVRIQIQLRTVLCYSYKYDMISVT